VDDQANPCPALDLHRADAWPFAVWCFVLTAGACPYANMCEQCDNFAPALEFIPVIEHQLADVHALREDAGRGEWDAKWPATNTSSTASKSTSTGSRKQATQRHFG
jgi:hypothetical protein